MRWRAAVAAALVLVAAGCGDDDAGPLEAGPDEPTATPSPQPDDAVGALFPDVIGVEVTAEGEGRYRFDVTISSPYDTPDQYADAWRVLGPDGDELGSRILTHDHANEQPFTRGQGGIEIPEDVTTVTVQGRDLVNGWGGKTMTVAVPR